MLWTCPHCRCDQVRWTPRLYTESELRRLRGPRLPGGGRAIVRTTHGWALDRPVPCPRCSRSFFPGDALMRGLPVEQGAAGGARSSAGRTGASARPGATRRLPGGRSALPG